VNGYRNRAATSLLVGILLTITVVLFVRLQRRSNEHGLPYSDSFALGQADEWTALGGTWEITANSIRNASDDRGAKFLTGSRDWEDYFIEADVMLMGTFGDAGLMIRTNRTGSRLRTLRSYLMNLPKARLFGSESTQSLRVFRYHQ
jgi:hypothetical protein